MANSLQTILAFRLVLKLKFIVILDMNPKELMLHIASATLPWMYHSQDVKVLVDSLRKEEMGN